MRQWRAANSERYCAHWQKAAKGRKTKRHEKSSRRFETARAAETERHLQMKAAQLRRSIIRGGVIADHAAWDWNFSGMVDHVDDHIVELEPAIIDFQYWFAA